MQYKTTITSKGTITIAAPIREALGLKPGQKVRLSVDNNKVVIDAGVTIEQFEEIRDRLLSKLPKHKKALTGLALREAAAKAWAANER